MVMFKKKKKNEMMTKNKTSCISLNDTIFILLSFPTATFSLCRGEAKGCRLLFTTREGFVSFFFFTFFSPLTFLLLV